jgi:hypothetical protein
MAQSTTLPKGFDKLPGGSNFWAGWDIKSGSTLYNPSKAIYLFDSSIFPWTGIKIIRELQVRRTDLSLKGGITAHTKKLRIFLSVDGNRPQRPDTGSFDGNHGKSKALVLGTSQSPKTINFLKTPQPPAGKTAAFDVRMVLDRPFVVPGGTKSMTLEIRSYSSSSSTGRWRPDCKFYGSANGGTSVTINPTKGCLTPAISPIHLSAFPGTTFTHRWQTRRQGQAFIGLIGNKLPTGIKLPGTTCELWANPLIFAVGISGTDTLGTLDMAYAKVPDLNNLVGLRLTHQLAWPNAKVNSLGLGLSVARETTFGSGYAATVPACVVYSYGIATSFFNNKIVNPDLEKDPRFFSGRALILNVK